MQSMVIDDIGLKLEDFRKLYPCARLYKSSFDKRYFEYLPQQRINPLREEQEVWKIISGDFELCLSGLERFFKETKEPLDEESNLKLKAYWDIFSAFLKELKKLSKKAYKKFEPLYRQITKEGGGFPAYHPKRDIKI